MQPIEDEVFKQIPWTVWQDVRYAKKDRLLQSNNSECAWDVVPGLATYPIMSSNHQSTGAVEHTVDHVFPMPIVPLGLGEVDEDKISHYANNIFQQVHSL
jgi:hypothetical protein